MSNLKVLLPLILLALVSCENKNLPVLETGSVTPMPPAWIDKDTGRKIIHLIPGDGENSSFYFHNNPFIPATGNQNEKMIFYRRVDNSRQIFSLDMKTKEITQLTNKGRVSGEIVGPKSRRVFYQSRDSVFATGVEDHNTRLIFVFPDSLYGGITTLNAHESLLGGSISRKTDVEKDRSRQRPEGVSSFEWTYEGKMRRSLITISVETGEMKIIHTDNAWLNHIQFSPTDPNLMMFCHEGPWHKVDRIWTIDVIKGIPKLMHKRTIDMEIAGHESFSPDGKKIWFDLQMPRGKNFFWANVDLSTGQETKYSLTPDEWSIHFTTSPDGKWFAGDGGDPSQVAKAKDGMWIYRFELEGDHLASERLVNMKHHNYSKTSGTEPNEHITPDGKWIIFRANFEGYTDIYAVEVAKSR